MGQKKITFKPDLNREQWSRARMEPRNGTTGRSGSGPRGRNRGGARGGKEKEQNIWKKSGSREKNI